MPYCKKCGLELDDDALFCPSCGTPVVKTKKSEKEGTPVKSEDKDLGGTILNTKQTYGIIDLERLAEDFEIDNRYKVIKKLGQGSFGAVYKVYDQKLEIEKALKIIPDAISNDEEAMNSLLKEASIMARLNHPSIVRVYDFHYTGDIKYIDMEYVEGESLAEIKLEKPDKRFSEEEVKEYTIQILEGLSYAHKKKVIHKDIKPQNIMLDESGMIRIMDFGIAESVHSSMSRLKNTGSSGTLVYMSPEQLRGKDVGKEADIYSLGATLYELLSGNPPFYRGDIYNQIINEKPVELKGISEYFNSIILKCLEKEKTKRFPDCEEFRKALLNKEKAVDEIKAEDLKKAKIKTITNEQKEKSQSNDQDQLLERNDRKKRRTFHLRLMFFIVISVIIAGVVIKYVITKHSRQDRFQKETGTFTTDTVKEAGTFTDQRDGQTYKWIKIGEQIWMAENLNYKPAYGSWCHDDKESNCNIYGRLYNWETAKQVGPDGWHLPTDEEWKELEMYLGMSQTSVNLIGWKRGTNVSSKLKSISGWESNGNGTNESGFTALPGGCAYDTDPHPVLGYYASFWSSTEITSNRALSRLLSYEYSGVCRLNSLKGEGCSVRCIRDY